MNKFIIVYNSQVHPVEGKSSQQIENKIRQDWEQNQDMDVSVFKSYGVEISFQDYAYDKVVVISLEEWFELNKRK